VTALGIDCTPRNAGVAPIVKFEASWPDVTKRMVAWVRAPLYRRLDVLIRTRFVETIGLKACFGLLLAKA
jgi:hypothetical protein